VAFATFAGTLWPAITAGSPLLCLGPLPVSRVQGLAVLAILVLTALNARGLALMVALPVTKPAYTWGSLAVVASGLPFFAWWRRRA
jgi:hypothetical protein